MSRLEKRTCLSSTCYRPSMVSNAFPDQSFSPCHHREIICSYIRTPTAPAVPRRYSFYAGCPSLPSTVGFSTTPFSDCTDSATETPLQRPTHMLMVNGRRGRKGNVRRRSFRDARALVMRRTSAISEYPPCLNFRAWRRINSEIYLCVGNTICLGNTI